MSKSLKNFITIKVCQMSVQSRENSLLVQCLNGELFISRCWRLRLEMTRKKGRKEKTETKNLR